MWIDLKQLLLKNSTNRTLILNGRQYVQLSSWILIGQKILGHSIYFMEMNCNRTLAKEIIMLNLLSTCEKKFLHNKKSLSFSFLHILEEKSLFLYYFLCNYIWFTIMCLLHICNFIYFRICGYSVQFSHSVMYNSLQPHGLQHARLPCPSPTPGACSNSCPLSRWGHPTISFSLILFFSSLQSFPASGSFSSESVLRIRWPNYWSFSFSPSPSNEYLGLISFRIDWFDLLVVQGTLKSLLKHHSSKTLILWCSALFIVQLSHPYMTTGKTIALTKWTSVSKVMSLLFNMLSKLVIAFLPRSKHLLFHGCSHHLQWFWSPKQ